MGKASVFGQNLEKLIDRWGVQQQDMELWLNVGRGVVSGYINGRSLARPAALLRLEEMTGIPIYRWLKTGISPHEIPPEPLKSYEPAIPIDRGLDSLLNTPLPELLQLIDNRISALELRVHELSEKCQ